MEDSLHCLCLFCHPALPVDSDNVTSATPPVIEVCGKSTWQLAFNLMQSVGEISYCSQVPPPKNGFDDDKVFVILSVWLLYWYRGGPDFKTHIVTRKYLQPIINYHCRQGRDVFVAYQNWMCSLNGPVFIRVATIPRLALEGSQRL